MGKVQLDVFAKSDVGRVRQSNEDNFLVSDLTNARVWKATDIGEPLSAVITLEQGEAGVLLAVADGMGGALAGEVASEIAVSTVAERMLQFRDNPIISKFQFSEKLRLAVETANTIINRESRSNPEYRGMGSTFTVSAIYKNKAYLGQIGDSRCYIMRLGEIVQITKDQSLVGQLVEAGYLTDDEAESHSCRNVILQALGPQPSIKVIVDCVELCDGDILLLCSDGLSGKVKRQEMLKIVESASDLKSACELLVYLANERGGEDNITVVLARITGDELPKPSPDEMLKIEYVERDDGLPIGGIFMSDFEETM
ncbi:MAG: protein phosphatase 2C domain-containing protein [Acidobacteriota bacterium]|nr:protein phosphatase 2C domain-containing protein [Blastocatellia bacterium]MDW8413035.1 protein phosphatase 2C domain-containing protein [Acidobacteriota bacterium]